MRTLEDLMPINNGEYLVILLEGLMAHVKYINEVKRLEAKSQTLFGNKAKSVELLKEAQSVTKHHLVQLKEVKTRLELLWCESGSFLQLLCQFALVEQLSQDIAEIIRVQEDIRSTLDLSNMVGRISDTIELAVNELTQPNAVIH